jgi:hypothetical protein
VKSFWPSHPSARIGPPLAQWSRCDPVASPPVDSSWPWMSKRETWPNSVIYGNEVDIEGQEYSVIRMADVLAKYKRALVASTMASAAILALAKVTDLVPAELMVSSIQDRATK